MRRTLRGLLQTAVLTLGALAAAGAGAHGGRHAGRPEPAALPATLRFTPPPPGSYELPPIEHVGEHRLLDDTGGPAMLPGLAPDELAVVAFVYASCPEGYGCPLALSMLQRLDRRLADHPALSERVQLVTVSFDPLRDTPERMAQLRVQLAPRSRWRFLTAESPEALQPVLEDFGQDVLPLVDAQGQASGLLRHVLKVFLVDGRHAVRNIYSVGFLSPEIIWADLRTLLLESELGGVPSEEVHGVR